MTQLQLLGYWMESLKDSRYFLPLCPRCALDAGGGAELNDGYFPTAYLYYLHEVLRAARTCPS